MLKKVITYTNPFTDEEVSEEHYFHISKADLVEMEMEEHNATYEKDGEQLTGMQAKLQRVIDSEDGKAILSEFKDIIRRSYGKKDGDRFIKSSEIWAEFSSSEAYSQLIFDLCTDAEIAGEFVTGIIPKNLDKIAEEIKSRADVDQSEPEIDTAPDVVNNANISTAWPSDEDSIAQILSPDEVAAMDSDELKSGLAEGRYKLS